MKKKISIFVLTLVLLLNTAIFAYATPQVYGYNEGESTSAGVMAKSIYDTYGIETYLVVDNDLGDGQTQQLADSVIDGYVKGEDYIIYAMTATQYHLIAGGKGLAYKQSIDAGELYEGIREYDEAGDYSQASSKLFSDLMLQINENYSVSNGALLSDTASAEGHYMVDSAELLSADEAAELEAKLQEISERQGMDVVAVTVSSLDGKSPMAFADDFYDYNGYGQGADKDGVLLLISVEARDWWISTTGYGITAFTDEGISFIGDEIVKYLKNDNWYKGINAYAENADKFITEAKDGTPYDIGHMPRSSHSLAENLKGILIALAVGAVIAFIYGSKVKKDYKPVRFKSNASDYLVGGSLQLTGQYDNFVTSHVTQTRIERDSGSGGSSTHSGSSGTSHGGGGGKF